MAQITCKTNTKVCDTGGTEPSQSGEQRCALAKYNAATKRHAHVKFETNFVQTETQNFVHLVGTTAVIELVGKY